MGVGTKTRTQEIERKEFGVKNRAQEIRRKKRGGVLEHPSP